jgi:trimeric autotransporter adhesin
MKEFIMVLIGVLTWLPAISQAPQKMSYQAVIRDVGGNLVVSKLVGMRITILKGALPGTVVYQETQTPTTNTNGLVTIEIGGGAGFDVINWGTGIHFIKTETDPSGGTNYTVSGTSQLLSVPYSLYAKDVQNNNDADADPGNELQVLTLNSSQLSLSRGGGTVTLPGDNWGTQVIKANSTITGDGTSVLPLGIAQQSATTGQVLKWNGSAWSPANDNNSGGGGLTLPFSGSISNPGFAFSVTNSQFSAISGFSASTSGLTSGIYGESASALGKGVFGKASSASGQPYGVYGEAFSAGGTGVYGKGGLFGLYGESGSENGVGLYAQATSTEGATKGIWGFSNSVGGVGVYGESAIGVRGVTNAGGGIAVDGRATATTGAGIGVYGLSSSANGTGVWAQGKDGVVAQSTGDDGCGVFAVDITGGGTKYGVHGVSYSSAGCGVYGESMSWNGNTFGIKGSVSSPTGFSGHFSGGKFYISGNTGLGTENPATKLHVLFNSTVLSPHLLLDENENDYARLMFKNTGSPTKSWSLAGLTSANDADSRLNFYYHNGTSGADIVTITGNGKVGIGTFNPQATLNVVGTVQVGAAGKAFSEIKEITGTLPTGGIYTFSYPSGYNKANIRVLTLEVFVLNRWYGQRSDFHFEYTLYDDYIMITNSADFDQKNFRMLVMKVE